MKKKLFSKQILLIIMLILISNIMFAESLKKDQSLIILTGKGQEAVVPDTAVITLGTQTRNKSIQVAFSENRNSMQKILDSLHKLGIEKKDIKTNNYSAYLEQNYDSTGKSTPGSYKVTNDITITVKDISKMGIVVNTAIENGANQMHGISFVASNSEESRIIARKKAIENARKKAETLANEAGVNIVGIYRIIEKEGLDYGYPVAAELKSSVSNVISAGTTAVTVNVEVHYIIQ